jgi:hypothetical protein
VGDHLLSSEEGLLVVEKPLVVYADVAVMQLVGSGQVPSNAVLVVEDLATLLARESQKSGCRVKRFLRGTHHPVLLDRRPLECRVVKCLWVAGDDDLHWSRER